MHHRLITCLLMFCLFWQSLACAGGAVLMADAKEKPHAALHFEGASHHHDAHDHGRVHVDESQASAQHLVDDACVHAPALLLVEALLLGGLSLDVPKAALPSSAPLPFLAGLERPPRLNRS